VILIQAIRNAMVNDLGLYRSCRIPACTAAIALGPLFESRGKTNGGQS
jgi:hypothetical protein